MKYSNLSEGIIKIPDSLYKNIEMYLASLICTQLTHHLSSIDFKKHRAQFSDDANVLAELDENTRIVKELLNQVQTKHKGKILSSQTFHNLYDRMVNIPLDSGTVFNDLPKNLQTDAVYKNLEVLKIQLLYTEKTRNEGYAGLSDRYTEENVHLIEIKDYVSSTDISDLRSKVENTFSTLYHEMQHLYQFEIIDFVDKSKKQVKFKDGYGDHDDNYYSSSVEFTTQVGDLGHATVNELTRMHEKGELTDSKVQDIKKAMSTVIKDTHSYKKVITALRKSGEENKANKALKIIYSIANKAYDSIKESDPKRSTEHDSTEHELESSSSALKIWEKQMRSKGLECTVYGSYTEPGSYMYFTDPDAPNSGRVTIKSEDSYQVQLNLNGQSGTFDLDRKYANEALSMINLGYEKDLSDELFDWLKSETITVDVSDLDYTLENFADVENFINERVVFDEENHTIRFIKSNKSFKVDVYSFMYTLAPSYRIKYYFERPFDVENFLKTYSNAEIINPEHAIEIVESTEDLDEALKKLDQVRFGKYQSERNDDYDE